MVNSKCAGIYAFFKLEKLVTKNGPICVRQSAMMLSITVLGNVCVVTVDCSGLK